MLVVETWDQCLGSIGFNPLQTASFLEAYLDLLEVWMPGKSSKKKQHPKWWLATHDDLLW